MGERWVMLLVSGILLTAAQAAPTETAVPIVGKSDAIEYEKEVTHTSPASNFKHQALPSAIIDGNHPDTSSKFTHEEIDSGLGKGEPTKRVKKILPPYTGFNKKEQPKATTTHAPKPSEPLRAAVVEELLVTEIRNEEDSRGAAGGENETVRRTISIEQLLPNKEKHTRLSGWTHIEGSPVGDTGKLQERTKAINRDVDTTDTTSASPAVYDPQPQIQGIRLVPNHPNIPAPPTPGPTLPHQLSDHQVITENFQQSSPNIENHELPFLYANLWQQVKDSDFQTGKTEAENDKKFQTSKTIPSFVTESSGEELTIPVEISRLLKLSEVPDPERDHRIEESPEPQGQTKWYLLLLMGNATIVQQRQSDFTKYLRLNLAARLSVEYDDIKVNQLIIAPPRVLVNISIFAPSNDIAEESQLDLKEKLEGEVKLNKLAENNSTILELSGEEYRVIRFVTLAAPQWAATSPDIPSAQAQYDEPHSTSIHARHEDIEFVIYTFLGSACACAVLLTLFMALNKYSKRIKECTWPWWKSRQTYVIEECHPCSPPAAVIYSGGLPQIRGSWMSGTPSETRDQVQAKKPSPKFQQRYPGIELHDTSTPVPESPRHNKLRMFNCQPDRVLVRKHPITLQNT